jgi:hypothetical protein
MIELPNIEKSVEFKLIYGFYDIYFVGGFSIENLEAAKISLINIETNKTILLKEKFLKLREYIKGKRVIKCYNFFIEKNSVFMLQIEHPKSIEMHYNYKLFFNYFNKKIDSENISIVIK